MKSGILFKKDTRKLQALIRTSPERADQLLRAAAEEMVSDIKLSFGPSPSSPGEPPGVVTNALRASMRWTPGNKPHTFYIVDGVVYGVYLELGTERMAARPFVAPVFWHWQHGKFQRFVKDWGLISG